MMNHCVPDFELDEEYAPLPFTPPPAAAGLGHAKKPAMGEEEIMELLWQNGQVNQRSLRKSHFDGGGAANPVPAAGEVRSTAEAEEMAASQNVFMQEDEMASWLHYPLIDSPLDRYLSAADPLYPASCATAVAPPPPQRDIRPSATEIRQSLAPRPPIAPGGRRTDTPPRFQNFAHFPRLSRPSIKSGPSRESTVVESNETPVVAIESRDSHAADSTAQVSGGNLGCGTEGAGPSSGGKETATCELTVTSSPGGSASGASVSGEKATAPAADDRKRKGRGSDDEVHNADDTDFGTTNAKKQGRVCSSSSTKRSRAAEVHNLSERRRRDRINEKMRALQELIPRCNKSDKASMLDEAIEYLKSLQLQVQMMSMGHCGMIPMMYPGMQPYMAAAMMGMGMNRPVPPYPSILPNVVGAATPMAPTFPIPTFPVQASSQSDPVLHSLVPHDPNHNHPRFPVLADPYQHFLGLHQAQVTSTLPQNQLVEHPINNKKPSSNKDDENPTTHQQYG